MNARSRIDDTREVVTTVHYPPLRVREQWRRKAFQRPGGNLTQLPLLCRDPGAASSVAPRRALRSTPLKSSFMPYTRKIRGAEDVNSSLANRDDNTSSGRQTGDGDLTTPTRRVIGLWTVRPVTHLQGSSCRQAPSASYAKQTDGATAA